MLSSIILSIFIGTAHAGSQSVFFQPIATGTVTGINCTTGTAVAIVPAIPNWLSGAGSTPIQFRIQNQDDADSVWLSYSNRVSTSTTIGMFTYLGTRLNAGSDGTWSLGSNPGVGHVTLWCKAADAAGALGVVLSREVVGIK